MQYKVTATWLSKKPSQQGFLVSAITTFLLAVASVMYWQNWHGAGEWMAVSGNAIFKDGHYWRALTALFAHSDGGHLFSNSFLFFILGSFLAGYFGTFVFPIMAFAFGVIVNLIIATRMPPDVQLLGASGMVYWMGGVWLMLYCYLDQKRPVSHRLLRAAGVALVLFFPAEAFKPEISYSSHFVGFISGILFGIFYFQLRKKEFLSAVRREFIVEDNDDLEFEQKQKEPGF